MRTIIDEMELSRRIAAKAPRVFLSVDVTEGRIVAETIDEKELGVEGAIRQTVYLMHPSTWIRAKAGAYNYFAVTSDWQVEDIPSLLSLSLDERAPAIIPPQLRHTMLYDPPSAATVGLSGDGSARWSGSGDEAARA